MPMPHSFHEVTNAQSTVNIKCTHSDDGHSAVMGMLCTADMLHLSHQERTTTHCQV